MIDKTKGQFVVLTEDTTDIAYQGPSYSDALRITNRLAQRKDAWLIDLNDMSVFDRSLLMFREIQINFNARIDNIEVPRSLETRLTLERISRSL